MGRNWRAAVGTDLERRSYELGGARAGTRLMTGFGANPNVLGSGVGAIRAKAGA